MNGKFGARVRFHPCSKSGASTHLVGSRTQISQNCGILRKIFVQACDLFIVRGIGTAFWTDLLTIHAQREGKKTLWQKKETKSQTRATGTLHVAFLPGVSTDRLLSGPDLAGDNHVDGGHLLAGHGAHEAQVARRRVERHVLVGRRNAQFDRVGVTIDIQLLNDRAWSRMILRG